MTKTFKDCCRDIEERHGVEIEKDPFIFAMITEAAELYRKESERWISVEDELPDEMQNVILIQDYGDHIGYFATEWTKEVEKYYRINNVTHWQPLPSPPEVG